MMFLVDIDVDRDSNSQMMRHEDDEWTASIQTDWVVVAEFDTLSKTLLVV